MRKVIALVVITLLMVASLQSPVGAALTPYGNPNPTFDPGTDSDHPWGGDLSAGNPGTGRISMTPAASTGNPLLDFGYGLIMKRFLNRLWWERLETTVTVRSNPAVTTPARSNGTTFNAAN